MERVQAGDIDRSQLNTTINSKFTPDAVSSMKQRLAPLGKPYGIAFGGAEERQRNDGLSLRRRFRRRIDRRVHLSR